MPRELIISISSGLKDDRLPFRITLGFLRLVVVSFLPSKFPNIHDLPIHKGTLSGIDTIYGRTELEIETGLTTKRIQIEGEYAPRIQPRRGVDVEVRIWGALTVELVVDGKKSLTYGEFIKGREDFCWRSRIANCVLMTLCLIWYLYVLRKVKSGKSGASKGLSLFDGDLAGH